MVRRERWLLSRDGRQAEISGISLWLIAVTQVQFAYLAADQLTPIKLVMGGYLSVASDQHHPAS